MIEAQIPQMICPFAQGEEQSCATNCMMLLQIGTIADGDNKGKPDFGCAFQVAALAMIQNTAMNQKLFKEAAGEAVGEEKTTPKKTTRSKAARGGNK